MCPSIFYFGKGRGACYGLGSLSQVSSLVSFGAEAALPKYFLGLFLQCHSIFLTGKDEMEHFFGFFGAFLSVIGPHV